MVRLNLVKGLKEVFGEITPRQAACAAYVAAGLNLAAALAMVLILQPGLPVEGSLHADRMTFVNLHPALWWSGWLVWHAAAIGLLAFYVGLAGRWGHRSPLLTTLALLCAAAGLAADLGAETIYMTIAPRLDMDGFVIAESVAGILTGYLGNGLYTVAGILLTWAGAGELPQPLLLLAVPVWAAGLSLSASSLVHSSWGQVWSTALLMPLIVLWTFLVGRWLGGQDG